MLSLGACPPSCTCCAHLLPSCTCRAWYMPRTQRRVACLGYRPPTAVLLAKRRTLACMSPALRSSITSPMRRSGHTSPPSASPHRCACQQGGLACTSGLLPLPEGARVHSTAAASHRRSLHMPALSRICPYLRGPPLRSCTPLRNTSDLRMHIPAFTLPIVQYMTHRNRWGVLERAAQLYNERQAAHLVSLLCAMTAKATRVVASAATNVVPILQRLKDRGIDAGTVRQKGGWLAGQVDGWGG